ncbi:MAG: hypothetical protein E6R03_00445 [Hyphomicrobiaceae bacterium]|jgi:hypothetical protein|nr:MAG: hypothetical protein E6R03_00445 [Hyphomicrobiaceae bacterium]
MTIAQRLGFYTIDISRVAGVLADDLLRDFAPYELSYQTTIQYLRTRYMRLVAKYGMPEAACNAVAEAGWKVVIAAGAVRQTERTRFAFYE